MFKQLTIEINGHPLLSVYPSISEEKAFFCKKTKPTNLTSECTAEFFFMNSIHLCRLYYSLHDVFRLSVSAESDHFLIVYNLLLNVAVCRADYYECPLENTKGRLLILVYPISYMIPLLPQHREIILLPEAQETCRQILDVKKDSPFSRQLIYLETEKLYLLLCRQMQSNISTLPISHPIVNALQKVLHTLAKEPDRFFTVAELAKIAEMHVHSFERSFKALNGITVHQYLHNTRMERARVLLRNGNESIKDIAYTLGFSSVSNFSRDYKRFFGHSPSKERVLK